MTIEDLLSRLEDPRETVRRLAVMDIARLEGAERRRALAPLGARLQRETDERTALAIIRLLAEVSHEPSREILRGLYDRRETPVRIAHAAILAHDAIELAARQVQSARGIDDGP